jgi:hypothetical protein
VAGAGNDAVVICSSVRDDEKRDRVSRRCGNDCAERRRARVVSDTAVARVKHHLAYVVAERSKAVSRRARCEALYTDNLRFDVNE